jgi:2-phospho-L-lactate guanylyltransferase
MMQMHVAKPRATFAVVPVKRLGLAKQRLAPVLSRHERAELVRTMLRDVLTTLCATPGLSGTIVVTADPEIAKLAALFDARVVADAAEAGVNTAVTVGLQALDRASAAVVVPADVPFATAADVCAVIGELARCPIVLAPALSDGGTNALAMQRPDLIAPAFGDGSFVAHQRRAYDAGLACAVVRTEGLGRDIDCPDDLLCRMDSRKSSLTAALLSDLNIADRLGRVEPALSDTVPAR